MTLLLCWILEVRIVETRAGRNWKLGVIVVVKLCGMGSNPVGYVRVPGVKQDLKVVASVPNRPGAPRGTAGIMPRGRDGWHRTGPLAVVRCRAKSSGDGRAPHARPFLV